MANGRQEANAVKRYLALAGAGPAKRGRPLTAESARAKLESIAGKLARTKNELKRLNLLSERMVIERELARIEREQSSAGRIAARAAFIEHAKSYSERHGIERAAWRAMGVDAETLRAAGL
jgi:hypothetical protein